MKVDRRYYNKLCRTECIRNSRRVFRLPCRSIKDASVARFVNLKQPTAQTKLRGKSKEGGRSPLLGRFKGDCQGGESKLPLDYSFFRPSTALSFSYEKESAVEIVRSHALCCAKKKGLNVSGPARDFLSEAGARLKAYRVYVEAAQRTSGRKAPSGIYMKAKMAFTHRYVI